MGKKILFGIILCICCFNMACGKSEDTATDTDLKLKWLLPAETEYISAEAEERVEQELESFFEDKNLAIDLCFMEKDNYTEQVTQMLQTEQTWDILFLNQELNQVMRNETRKFFAPITDLLDTEYQQMYDLIPEYAWDVMTVNKEIYAIPNKHCWACQEGYYVEPAYLKAYGKGMKADSVAKFGQIGDFLKQVTYKEDCVGTYIPQDQWEKELHSHGFYFSGGLETLGVVREIRGNYIVENMFETPEFEAYCYRMRNWQKDGYIREDSVIRDVNEAVISQEKEKGLFALEPIDDIALGMEEEHSLAALPTSEIIVSSNKVAEYATAFNVNSEYLPEAMAVVETIYHDKTIYNTILYGIEGKHFEKINDRQIRKIADSGYGPDDAGAVDATVLGNQYLSYLMGDSAYDQWETLEEWEENARVPENMGFFFRTTNVLDDIRNVSAILDSDLRLLETGSVDVDLFLPEFRGKLREAGADRIIAEYQVQLTRWINNKSEY